MIAGRSRARPAPTTIDTSVVVMGWALPPRRSSTICWRRLTGSCWSVRVVRSSSLVSSTRAKRKSSSLTSPTAPSARATASRASAYAWLRSSAISSPDRVDVVLDELRLGRRVEVLVDHGGGGTDGQLGELAPQVGGGLGLGGLDVGGGASPGLGQLRLEPGLLVLLQRVGRLAGLLDDPGGFALGVGQLGLVAVEHARRPRSWPSRPRRGRCGCARCGCSCPP